MKALVIGATGAVGKDLVEQLLTGDVLFSCLGTTIKAAGSQEAQWKVDYTYQFEAAKAARNNGVRKLVLVSSIGADAKSRIFYSRMKGQLDEDVAKLGFPGCFILRPPSLIRKGSDRFGEKAGVAILKALNAIGLMRSWKPMPTEEVAQAMIRLAKADLNGTRTYDLKSKL